MEMADTAQTVCTKCGTVLTENNIVSEVTFGETGSGAAMVQGSYVGADQSELYPFFIPSSVDRGAL
jgi:transcription factor IIIB subunit 2